MTVLVAKLIWGLGCVAYFIIRYPHQRRARKTNVTDRRDLVRERTLMLMSYSGLFVVPLIYVLTDQPKFASYRFSPIQASLGALVLIAAMHSRSITVAASPVPLLFLPIERRTS